MLKDLLINQVIPQLCYLVITTLVGIVTYEVKKFLASKYDLIESQRQQLVQKIGIDRYNHDLAIARGIIMGVEQMGREYNWESAIKHARATELISERTGLSQDDIFNIIKATVSEFNKNRSKTSDDSSLKNKDN